MAYNNYFIKVDGVILPNSFIQYDTFISFPQQRGDEKPGRDANFDLHRNVLPHKKTRIEFDTIHMTAAQKTNFLSYFPNRDVMTLEFYDEWTENYDEGQFYMADPKFQVYTTALGRMYRPVHITLIQY